jgi:hypothetical protein
MKAKITALLAGKRKVATVAACAALVLAFGAITAFAASGGGASLVRVQDGNVAYSKDDGKIWVNGTPKGFSSDGKKGAVIIDGTEDEKSEFSFDGESGFGVTKNPDGSVSIGNQAPDTRPAEAKGSSLVRVEDGNIRYSTDNGKTWRSGAPEGFRTETDENGATHSWVGDRPANGNGAFTAENENGKLQYRMMAYSASTARLPGFMTSSFSTSCFP